MNNQEQFKVTFDEAKKHLSTHPDYDYNDGRTFILLYAGGKPNFEDKVKKKAITIVTQPRHLRIN